MAAMGVAKTIILYFLQAAQIFRFNSIQHILIECLLYPSQCSRYKKYSRGAPLWRSG